MTRRKKGADIDALFADAQRALEQGRRGVAEVGELVHDIAGDLDFDLALAAAPESPALVIPIAANRKLAPVEMQVAYRADGTPFARKRPVPLRPHVSSTYLPVKQTCPPCPFKGNGCMAESGYTGRAVKRLEQLAEGFDATQLVKAEAREIDRLCARGVPRDGGRDGKGRRDMRLHVSGDVTTLMGLRVIARAVERWQRRGGGQAWTFTHAWARLPRMEWGVISVLASVEHPDTAERAWSLGYAPAITVREFPSTRAFQLEGSRITWIPCPAETGKATCVQCRLCLDRSGWLHMTRRGIAFAVHGPQDGAAKKRLPVLSSTGTAA